MPQTAEDSEQAHQPSCGSTAETAAGEDVRSGTTSVVLTQEEHMQLLVLERTFSNWPSRRSKVPRVLNPRTKWIAIRSEMQALFPHLEVRKETLRRICVRARKQRELRELQRFKVECSDENDVKLVVGSLKNEVKLWKEKAEDEEKKLAEAEVGAAGLQSALLERSKKCEELERMMRSEKDKTVRLRKQLRQEVEWRLAQLQGPDEADGEAEADEAAS